MKIVLIGASVRPLMASCIRAGCVPVAFDFFADWDARRLAEEMGGDGASLTKIDRYADVLKFDLSELGDAAILAGGAELRSELVEAVDRQLPLLGTKAEALTTISDPVGWLEVLQAAGLPVPETCRELPNESAVSWLVKQSRTCGGVGVRVVDSEDAVAGEATGDRYYQKRIAGESMSALLVSRRSSAGDVAQTFSLGCTRQWLAGDIRNVKSTNTEHASPFAYRGSIGPILISESVQQQIHQLGNVLAERFGLQGVWGMDFVLDDTGQVWPVDLNPRITASAELFEAALARAEGQFRSVVDLHLAACDADMSVEAAAFGKLAVARVDAGPLQNCEAKRIVYLPATEAVEINEVRFEKLLRLYRPEFFQSDPCGASIADVPRLGDRIEGGQPLLTIRSRAANEAAALARLDELDAAVAACLGDGFHFG